MFTKPKESTVTTLGTTVTIKMDIQSSARGLAAVASIGSIFMYSSLIYMGVYGIKQLSKNKKD